MNREISTVSCDYPVYKLEALPLIRYKREKIERSYDRCEQITRREARNFYFGFISLPAFRRRSIAAVYALSRRWDDIADGDLSTERKAELLSEEESQLNQIQNSRSSDPVLIAIQHSVDRFSIPWSYFYQLLDGVRMDLSESRYETLEDLLEYCYHVASVPGLIVLEIFGYNRPEAREHAVSLGYAMQLTNILRDVLKDLNQNRIYLPLNNLHEQGIREADLLEKKMYSPALGNVLEQVANRARFYFRKSRQLFPLLVPSSRSCPLVLMNLYQTLLRKIKKRNYNIFDHPVELTTPEKLYILFNSIFFHPGAV